MLPPGGPIHHSSSDHYYSPPHGPKEDRGWSSHMDSYDKMVGKVSARSPLQRCMTSHLLAPGEMGTFFEKFNLNFWFILVIMGGKKKKKSTLIIIFYFSTLSLLSWVAIATSVLL